MHFVLSNYSNKLCQSLKEFQDDLNHIHYVKRFLFKQFRKGYLSEAQERMLINHIIILSNVFGVKVTVFVLFLKIPKNLWSFLKHYLRKLDYIAEDQCLVSINDEVIVLSEIEEISNSYNKDRKYGIHKQSS